MRCFVFFVIISISIYIFGIYLILVLSNCNAIQSTDCHVRYFNKLSIYLSILSRYSRGRNGKSREENFRKKYNTVESARRAFCARTHSSALHSQQSTPLIILSLYRKYTWRPRIRVRLGNASKRFFIEQCDITKR